MIVTHLPRGSALVRVIEGDDHPWGLTEQLLAAAVDALHAANWQRGEGKKRDKPKPIPRPGVAAEKKYGSGAIPMDEMADWLGWENQFTEPVVPVDEATPPDSVMQMEHDMSIAGHELDCSICAAEKPARKRDAKGRFTKS